MKKFKTYLSLLLVGALSLTACQDDFDDPAMADPSSTWLADADNYQPMTILQVKEKFWSDDTNYYWTDSEGKPYIPTTDEGKHMLIKGRVISSDASGNVYKKLVIQDETAAIAFSINANSMNNKFRRGQEIVVDITGMTIGKYAGLQQFGFPEDSERYGRQTTFMPYQFFLEHVQMNGQPNLAEIDTLLVNDFSQLSGGPEVLRKWQSQLVRFNNCSFVNGGKATFAESKETVSQKLTVNGGSLDVRTSGYSNFYADVLPEGNGDVVALLEYFNSAYQLTLLDRRGCMNFGNPTIGPGGEDNPYKVDEAIAIIAGGGAVNQVWTTGYIVGAVAAGVQDVTSNTDIEFAQNPDLPNTLVIAPSADCKEWNQCMVIELPAESALRKYGNLVDNPSNYKKQIWILGNLGKVLGTFGVTGNNGSASSFRIDGVTVPDTPGQPSGNTAPDFNTMNNGEATGYYQASMTSTNGWVATNAQLLQGGSADASPVFTVFGDASVYAVCLNGKAGSLGTLTSPVIAGGLKTLSFDYTQPFSDTKCKLTINIKQNGAVVASDVLENNGMTKLKKYTYSHDFNVSGDFVIEILNDGPSAQSANKDRVAIWNISWGESTGGNTPENPDTPDQPVQPVGGNTPDFNTMNEGKASSYYTTPFTSANGWTTEFCSLLQGGDSDVNPVFTVFGDASVFAVCLNGRTAQIGKLTSPTLAGGLKTLSFDYCQPFSDNKCKLTINIKQNGAVVASDVLENNGMTKLQKYTYSHDFNVTGNFVIEIVNDCPSALDKNKDRVALWNMTWSNM